MGSSSVLFLTNYGSLYKSEFILRFRILKGIEEQTYGTVIEKFAKTSTLLHVEPSGDNLTSKLTFDILMVKDAQPNDLSNEIAALDGVSEVILIASKTDIDY